jgi:nucleoside-triphosphatase THEP1
LGGEGRRGDDAPMVVVLTGDRGVGKSTVCHKALAIAQAKGYVCGGVVTTSHPDSARQVLNARTGLTRWLTLEPGRSNTNGAVVQGRFRFDAETVAWGNTILACATPCDLLFVDELGPLEIERVQGWQKAFDVLLKGDYTLGVVVVRPRLLEALRSRLYAEPTILLHVTLRNRDDLPSLLVDMLETKLGPF